MTVSTLLTDLFALLCQRLCLLQHCDETWWEALPAHPVGGSGAARVRSWGPVCKALPFEVLATDFGLSRAKESHQLFTLKMTCCQLFTCRVLKHLELTVRMCHSFKALKSPPVTHYKTENPMQTERRPLHEYRTGFLCMLEKS